MASPGERVARAFERRGVVLTPGRADGVVGVATRDSVLPDWLLSAATTDAVRCPECGKKLGDRLVGTYETTCPRCKRKVTITR
jgi:DNA-directed RNA polymerase subunit RPC12/RpoP